jgi:hypothetical protein
MANWVQFLTQHPWALYFRNENFSNEKVNVRSPFPVSTVLNYNYNFLQLTLPPVFFPLLPTQLTLCSLASPNWNLTQSFLWVSKMLGGPYSLIPLLGKHRPL